MLHYADFNHSLNELVAATHWYVGFSGGVDSTVLLHLLHAWRSQNSIATPLSAIHVNHGLQTAAPLWQRHCEHVCQSLGLPLLTRIVDVGSAGSGEAAAREVRYRAFEEQLQPGAVLFLAHHLDDQVETFFLRLMRGAGVEGLAGMPGTRALGAGTLVRPLLHCTRSEIEEYAARHDLGSVQDSSNSDITMDRNFLRAQMLPLLGTRWPAYRQSIARASEHMAVAAGVLADGLGVPQTVYSAMGDKGLRAQELITAQEAVAAIRLRAWLRLSGCRAPDQAALAEFLRQLRSSAADANPQLVCGDYVLQHYGEGVYRVPVFDEPPPMEDLVLATGERRVVPGVGIVSLLPAVGAGLRLGSDDLLTLHWRRGGERCHLPGRVGSSSVKRLLQEHTVPPWWRNRLPLLSLKGELLAIGDIAQCKSDRWCQSAPAGENLWSLRWERVFHPSCD